MTKEDFSARITGAQGRMYRVARSYLRGEQDCLDAISETILKAWQKKDGLREERYFDTWLTRILIRECINIQRAQKRVVPMETPPETPSVPSKAPDVRDALDALPQKLRAAAVLHYMEGFPVADVAKAMRAPKGTVTSWLHYARLRLREALKEEIE